MAMIGSGDWLTKSERLVHKYVEEHGMFGGADDVDEFRAEVEQMKEEGIDLDEFTHEDIKRHIQDKKF
jgi:hypothetical protein